MTTATKTTAQTISEQIPGHLKMALGMRDYMQDSDTLYFRMTGTRAVYASIRYNADADLYTLCCWTLRKFVETVRYEAEMIDASGMIQTLDFMDRGLIEL